jgi:riboflavin biosynthesis pyrimidine reductase
VNSVDRIRPLVTIEDHSAAFPVVPIGNDWSRRCFDGPFYLHAAPPGRPAISLVFVESRDGNTAAHNPADLGGGPTDKYLIYEGLSRVAADAVLAGASTIGHGVFFAVEHPELLALRLSLGLPRHLVQMVLSNDGNVDLSARIFNTPDVRVVILSGARCLDMLTPQLRDRPWITLLPIGDSLADAFTRLRREHGIGRISAVGGRRVATSLVDAGLVQDIYLTTTAIDAGEPGTPWYVGARPPSQRTIVRKREAVEHNPITFAHLSLMA